MRTIHLLCFTTTTICLALAGCGKLPSPLATTWHQKFGWKAEDYFDNAQVVALCRAVEINDLPEIDRLIATGANVNAKGKGHMTPLMWAFPDNKRERFKLLLEYNADPNVIIQDDFGTKGAIMAGEAVTHLASETTFPGYFEDVFEHGGDPNLAKQTSALGKDDTPIFCVITSTAPDKKERIKLLVQKGADLNHMNSSWATPAMLAVGWGGQYDLALTLLEAGADYSIYKPRSNSRLIHIVLAEERRSSSWSTQQKADYQKLLSWLTAHGESIEQAKSDRARWKSWSQSNGEYRRKMDEEIAKRQATEEREKREAESK
jgi:uncharacterized protein